MSRFLDAGSVATGGVTLVVDGLESTRVPVSASAIQEVKINQNPYSAEFSRPGRGRIEIITKPGSQEYHGTLNFLFRDYLLNARDPFAVTRPNEQRRIFEGNLAGPVGHSKTTSFMIRTCSQGPPAFFPGARRSIPDPRAQAVHQWRWAHLRPVCSQLTRRGLTGANPLGAKHGNLKIVETA